MDRVKRFEEWKPFMLMIAIDFAFAIVNTLLKKVLDEGINPFVLVTYRLSISSIFLAPIGYFWERDSRQKITVRILCYLFFSAIIGASLTQYSFLLGIQYTSATFACAFVNMVPVVTFLVAVPFRLETVHPISNSGRAKIIGTLVCISGAALLTVYKGPDLVNKSNSRVLSIAVKLHSAKKTAGRWTLGTVALIIGTLLWSSWFLLQSNIGKRYPYQYSSIAIMSFFGAIQSAILSLFTGGSNLSTWALKGKIQIMTVLYSGIIGSGLCFVGMSWCVKKRGPVFTAAFSPLVQILAAVLNIPLLHEQLHLGSLLGSVIVIIGLYILLWGKNKEMRNCLTKVLDQETEDIKEQDQQIQVITVPSRGP